MAVKEQEKRFSDQVKLLYSLITNRNKIWDGYEMGRRSSYSYPDAIPTSIYKNFLSYYIHIEGVVVVGKASSLEAFIYRY
jgi:hypothetical protein